MKARGAWAIGLAAGLLLASCGVPGDGTIGGCVGSFTGTYSGSEEGMVTALLFDTGKLTGTFSAGDADRTVTAMVADTGEIGGATGSISITGTFVLDDCTASGDWTIASGGSGTWSAQKR